MAPLSGAPSDEAALTAAAALAAPFEAELAAVFAPADAADLMPWMGEGFMGGVQVAALDSLKEAAEIGEKHATAHFAASTYAKKTFPRCRRRWSAASPWRRACRTWWCSPPIQPGAAGPW